MESKKRISVGLSSDILRAIRERVKRGDSLTESEAVRQLVVRGLEDKG